MVKGGQGRDPEDVVFSAWVVLVCILGMIVLTAIAAL